MAVFEDFHWDSSVKYPDENVAEFKKINILYGRNYSGKTTLSRIFRALETGSISKKYGSPEFELSFNGENKVRRVSFDDDGNIITQSSPDSNDKVIRVFNEDFVKEHLRFIANDEETITSFAILGKKNIKIEEEIKKYEAELGSKENGTGLFGELLDAEKEFDEAKKNYDEKFEALERTLRGKINNLDTGIRHNTSFRYPTYNVPRLKKDIATVRKASYTPLTNEQMGEYYALLREEPKKKIPKLPSFNSQYLTIASEAKVLIEKEIYFPSSLKSPRSHLNIEYEELRTDLEKVLAKIEDEQERILTLLSVKKSDFYSKFATRFEHLATKFAPQVNSYNRGLNSIKQQVEKRKKNLATSISAKMPAFAGFDVTGFMGAFEKLRNESNRYTTSLNANQSEARWALRLHEVYRFIIDIKYKNEHKGIASLKEKMDEMEVLKTTAKDKIDAKQAEINETESRLKDESHGADRVNEYLNHSFGHKSISLKVIKENSADGASKYRFKVTRNGEKAVHLSEGERNLIAFCYFMAKLEDIETKGKQPIIWIDDPVSSLDTNHIFFIYSLIAAKIVTPENNADGKKIKEDRFRQLFISTHNLTFLKYLKQLPGKQDQFQHFIITRTNSKTSEISLMPPYMKKYATEFNFLFHQIYKCAHAQIEGNENHACDYNFANNARKFLETFLYYKYPNTSNITEKLLRFFGDDPLTAFLTSRIINEFSHMSVSVIEQGFEQIDVPKIKKVANFIIDKMEDNDSDQYKDLLKSIGEDEESTEAAQ